MTKVLSYSLTIEHEGEIIVINQDGVLPTVPTGNFEYAVDGWSKEMRHGCVRNQKVDAYLDAMAVGDAIQRKQAEIVPRWFAILVPGREYEDAIKINIIRNYQQDKSAHTLASGYTGALIMQEFYPDIVKTSAPRQYPSRYNYGDALDGYRVPIYGFNPAGVAAKFADMYLRDLALGLDRLRADAARGPNVVRPGYTGR